MSFAELGLSAPILKALEQAGYNEPTPIQARAIPEILAGHDLMASAQTGTGKTAAFMLPSLEKLTVPSAIRSRGPRVLVLTPTRELAMQVSQAAMNYGRQVRHSRVVSIVGGMPYPKQNKMLSQPFDILVATPGRLIDHMQRGRIDFSRLELLILDEADRMLDMGFFEDVEQIAQATPATRQTLMFSATFEGTVARLAQQLLKEPKRIEIAAQTAKHENIEQRLHYVDDLDHKNRLLDHLLRDTTVNQAIVFTATKRDADTLADGLYDKGFTSAALHGDMTQGARNRTLTQLRNGRVKILVATDVAARGIDVAGITHVINYDLPKFAEDYVHRIGRTGRAGASGIAVSFASHKDMLLLRRIERFTGQKIAAHTIEGLEPKRIPSQSKPFSKPRGSKHQHSRGRPQEGGYAGRKTYGDGQSTERNDRRHGHRPWAQDASGGREGAARTDRPWHGQRPRDGERQFASADGRTVRTRAASDGNTPARRPRKNDRWPG